MFYALQTFLVLAIKPSCGLASTLSLSPHKHTAHVTVIKSEAIIQLATIKLSFLEYNALRANQLWHSASTSSYDERST